MCVCVCVCVCARYVMSSSFVTVWTVAHQVPLSMEFPRQEYCSGLPFPSPGDLLNPGILVRAISWRGCESEGKGREQHRTSDE